MNTQVVDLKFGDGLGIKITNTKGFYPPPKATDKKSAKELLSKVVDKLKSGIKSLPVSIAPTVNFNIGVRQSLKDIVK